MMTRLAYYVTNLKADVLFSRDHQLKAYDRFPDTSLYWSFLDLVGSSNFRLAHGAKEGYVRADSFYTLVDAAIAPYGKIRHIKELGDGVLLASEEIRPLFEACMLIGQTARELSEVAGAESFPFGVRMAIGYGPAKRLSGREPEDFVGSPIDITARLVGAAEPNELLIQDVAVEPSLQVLDEYESFAKLDGPQQLSESASKHMVKAVFYYRVNVTPGDLNTYENHFGPWASHTDGRV
jgi:class 3 adenylate cyclase